MPKITNKDSLRDVIKKLTPEDGELVKAAINKTRNFLLITSLQFQVRREEVITPTDIEKILSEPAEGLKALRSEQVDDKARATRVKEILDYCRMVIEKQLGMLCEHNDSIYQYYKSNPNALKEELDNKSKRPKP